MTDRWEVLALRERREQMRAWAEAKERRGKYRKAFRRSMRASSRHWQIKRAAMGTGQGERS